MPAPNPAANLRTAAGPGTDNKPASLALNDGIGKLS